MASPPFEGIRVVEFGQFVAVPFCGQVLAEGGAEIIKVESPEGDPNRHMGEVAPGESRIFISRNRGKHALPLKLSDPGAKKVIDALLDWADVVLMNFRPGLAGKMGLDASELQQQFPRLIIGEITPFGKAGPDAALPGMDIVVQARTGLMAAMGRIVDDRPAPGDPVISDYMAAMSLAYGVASALFRRERTGKGGVVDVSLMKAAMTLTNNQLVRAEDLDRDRHQAEIEHLNRLRQQGATFAEQLASASSARVLPLRAVYFRTFDTGDAAIAVACASRGLQERFIKALGLEDLGHVRGEASPGDDYYLALAREVEDLIRSRPAEHWLSVLREAGVPTSTVKLPVEMFEDEQAIANDMFYFAEHGTAGRFRVLSPPVSLDDNGFTGQPLTAPFGSETVSILSELGFSASDIDALLASGITTQSL
ncbi:MAG: CaiB/BaiF CoA transferase family protein [Pseudomonadota bacterium]